MILKCFNCGAPLPKTSDRCEYCGTLNDTDLRRLPCSWAEDIASSDLPCPRCITPLTRINLRAGKDFQVLRCGECLGFFFDPQDLEELLKLDNQERGRLDFSRFSVLAEDNTRREWPVGYIKCPICGDVMNRKMYGVRSGVIADRCKEHGIWLDGGELGKLLKWERTGGLERQALYEQEAAEERKAALANFPALPPELLMASRESSSTTGAEELFAIGGEIIRSLVNFFRR